MSYLFVKSMAEKLLDSVHRKSTSSSRPLIQAKFQILPVFLSRGHLVRPCQLNQKAENGTFRSLHLKGSFDPIDVGRTESKWEIQAPETEFLSRFAFFSSSRSRIGV